MSVGWGDAGGPSLGTRGPKPVLQGPGAESGGAARAAGISAPGPARDPFWEGWRQDYQDQKQVRGV